MYNYSHSFCRLSLDQRLLNLHHLCKSTVRSRWFMLQAILYDEREGDYVQ